MEYLEIIGTAVGLAYLWLEYRASIWLWLAGIVMPALYVFIYYDAGFYADMAINGYYFAAGIYGWMMWRNKKGDGGARRIAHTPVRFVLPLVVFTAAAFAAIAAVLVRFTDSTVPYGDSFTTALSIAALWMLSRKYAEQWLVWIAVDAVSAGLYFYKGLYPTGALYTLYAVVAAAGYFKWLKLMQDEQHALPDA
ncbi:MAG TPA: nicotinamide riboside transporter PnuC [Candidatus Tidjanibacter gallistercoris]|nr:nicotinamide riboside transporter PnuC [Candidatus Tidjanibacter gallistercoris]